MITLAAIKENNMVYVGKKGQRHDSVINDMITIHKLPPPVTGIQGFVDESGTFYNRHDAAKHAFECGQLPNDDKCPEIILSENLW